ncbi:hypothetical protein AURDEDRAFT_187546 [Auricularia subglabra TFB-10046 SS5]|uniref:F-box domain-containing protein n=1 Tax=Auricularia subglabra (strain TFB-10046 / SS5) TaxID=717982 RepID=J0D180_AURST|nr:hypothetical protein AURDEDRAFT_187546 [Auricularia subglabra TFB-10046 SS5]
MEKLADELLKMIITPPLLVPDELFADGGDLSPFSKATFSASEVLLVCKRFMRIATPVLYETVIIRSKAQALALQAALTRNPEFGQFVRKLRLEGAYGRELAKVIPTMPYVTDFCFTLGVFVDESLAGLTAAFNTFEPTRVILTLLDARRGSNSLHRSLVVKLCAAIHKWTKLRHFSYSKATRWSSEFLKESDIATALAGCRTLQTVDVSERSWGFSHMPDGLNALLANPSIRQIRLLSLQPIIYQNSFYHQCDPEVKRRLCLVRSDGVQDTPAGAIAPVLLTANPFYHPMQNAPLEQRVDVWRRVISFLVYRESPDPGDHSWFWRTRYRMRFWFESSLLDHSAAHNLLIVSRDYGLVAALSPRLGFRTDTATQYWRGCLKDCPAIGKEVRSMVLDNGLLATDPTIDELFLSTPNLRELDLGWLGPDAMHGLQRVGPIIGHTLRSLTLSRRRGPLSVNPWYEKTDVFSCELFAGFTALEKLKVELGDLRFSASTASSDVLPNLQELEVGEVNGSLLTLLAHAELPKLQSFTIHVAVRKADSFIKQHGPKLLRVQTTTGFNEKNFAACPNLQSLKLSEEVQPSFIYDLNHLHLARLELNWLTVGAKWMAKYREVCNSISPSKFPALKEIVAARKQEIWPGNEREAKKSPWPMMATKLAEQGIILQDHTGRTWRQRLQVQ